MRNFVSLLLILTGLVFTAVSLFQFYQHSASAKDSLQKAEQLPPGGRRSVEQDRGHGEGARQR